MDRDTIGLALASTLAGLAVLLTVVALAKQPFLLLFAVPFAVGAYLVWQGATGQFSFGPSRTRRVNADARSRAGGRGGARTRGWQQREAPGRQARAEALARREASRVLGVEPGADAAAVKAAYREKVKRAHPDAPGGDDEQFRRVNQAYETLKK